MVRMMLFLHYILSNSLCKKIKIKKEVILCVYRFQKAFDFVDRRLSCLKLSKVALKKIIGCYESVVCHVKPCTGVDNFLSECFCNNLGLMKAG